MRRGPALRLLLGAAGVLSGTHAYPAIMLQPAHCKTPLSPGSVIMGAPAVQTVEPPPLLVTRSDGEVISSGGVYKSGDYLQVKYTGTGQQLLEVGGQAIWTSGGCSDTRIALPEASLALPMGKELPDISIKIAYSSKFGKVSLTQPFMLKSPNPSSTTGAAATPAPPPPVEDLSGVPALKHRLLVNPDERVELSYEVSPDKDYVDVQIKAPGKSWVAAGVVTDGPAKMVVKDNPHKVLLYPHVDGKPALVSLNSVKASGIVPVAMDDKAIKVLFTQDSVDGVVLRYRLFASTNPLLRLGGKNAVMWARSLSAWPAIHSSSDGVEVDWGLGLLDKSEPPTGTGVPPAPAAPAPAPAPAPGPVTPALPASPTPPTPPTSGTTGPSDLGGSLLPPAAPPGSSSTAGGGAKDEQGNKAVGSSSMPSLRMGTVLSKEDKVHMSYEVSPKADYVDVQISAPAKSWVAVGVVEDGPIQMVSDGAPHKVMLYPSADGSAQLVALTSLKASGVTPVTMDPTHFQLLATENSADGVLLRYRMFAAPGSLLKPSGKNTVMWAHSPAPWPVTHTGRDGLVVDWSLGSVSSVASATPSHYFAGIALLLLPLLALPLIATTLRHTPMGRALLQKRLASSTASNVNGKGELPFPWGVWDSIATFRLGEAAMVGAYAAVHVGLMLMWYGKGMGLGSGMRAALTTASGYGSLTNLMMITLPVSKTALWTSLLGLSFDRAIKFHRVLGRYTLLLLALHLAVSSDVYLFDFVSTDGLRVMTGWGFLAFATFCLVALSALDAVRRRLFEAFKLLHYLSLLGLLFTALHLPTAVFGIPYFVPLAYLSLPVLLYVVDVVLRLTRTNQIASLTELTPLPGGATRVQVSVSDTLAAHGPGSYFFLQLPTLSALEWHPYSVCAGSADPTLLTFVIKDEGAATWSHRVRELAQTLASQNRGLQGVEETPIRVGGPYGCLSVNLGEYDRLLLVGGGVGVTPLTSTLHHIGRAVEEGRLKRLESVELVWVVRSASVLSWFEELLLELQEARAATPTPTARAGGAAGATQRPKGPDDESKDVGGEEDSKVGAGEGVTFRVRLYVTEAKRGDVTEAGLRYESGRPDLEALVARAARGATGGKKKNAAVIACGPQGMLATLRNAAGAHDVAMHEEVFHW